MNWDLAVRGTVFAQHVARLFCVAFSKATARRVGEKNALFFLQSFFFWGYLLKRKSVYQILIAKGVSRFSLP
jgi:hypothetical protein